MYKTSLFFIILSIIILVLKFLTTYYFFKNISYKMNNLLKNDLNELSNKIKQIQKFEIIKEYDKIDNNTNKFENKINFFEKKSKILYFYLFLSLLLIIIILSIYLNFNITYFRNENYLNKLYFPPLYILINFQICYNIKIEKIFNKKQFIYNKQDIYKTSFNKSKYNMNLFIKLVKEQNKFPRFKKFMKLMNQYLYDNVCKNLIDDKYKDCIQDNNLNKGLYSFFYNLIHNLDKFDNKNINDLIYNKFLLKMIKYNEIFNTIIMKITFMNDDLYYKFLTEIENETKYITYYIVSILIVIDFLFLLRMYYYFVHFNKKYFLIEKIFEN